MQRAILVPANLAGAATDDLKAWLAITTTRDDGVLATLLNAALDMCEAFTGQIPLEVEGEEMLAASQGWQRLASRPIHAIKGVEAIGADGGRTPLPAMLYAVDLDANGGAAIRLTQHLAERRVAVRFVAGMAPDWRALPDGLRHGVLRFAAHHFRARDDAAEAKPPAAVAALWRPWRRMRLA